MMKNSMFLKAVLLASMAISGCVSQDDGTVRWINGELMVASPEEVSRKQDVLLNANTPDELERIADGGVVFEGTATNVAVHNDAGLHIVEIAIDQILYGDLKSTERIKIHTPSAEKGGVDFKVGKKYRVLAAFFGDAYRTWASSGTAEIQN